VAAPLNNHLFKNSWPKILLNGALSSEIRFTMKPESPIKPSSVSAALEALRKPKALEIGVSDFLKRLRNFAFPN
jgi:hypothetical protein